MVPLPAPGKSSNRGFHIFRHADRVILPFSVLETQSENCSRDPSEDLGSYKFHRPEDLSLDPIYVDAAPEDTIVLQKREFTCCNRGFGFVGSLLRIVEDLGAKKN